MANNQPSTYAILAGTTITGTGISNVYGNIGSNTTASGTINLSTGYSAYTGSDITTAITNAATTYNSNINMIPTTTISVSEIGGTTFTPGIIQLTSTNVTISSSIILDGGGDTSGYIFQIPNGGLTTNPTSASISYILQNGALASRVYWFINGSVSIQTVSSNITNFPGTIYTNNNATIGSGSIINGSLIGFLGSITINTNTIRSNYDQSAYDNTVNTFIGYNSTILSSDAIRITGTNASSGMTYNSGSGGISNITTGSNLLYSTLASSNAIRFITTGDMNIISGTNGISHNSINNINISATSNIEYKGSVNVVYGTSASVIPSQSPTIETQYVISALSATTPDISPAFLLNRILFYNGASQTFSLPLVSSLISLIQSLSVVMEDNDSFDFSIVNLGNTVTLSTNTSTSVPTGFTFFGINTIVGANTAWYRVVFTSITSSTANIYYLG